MPRKENDTFICNVCKKAYKKVLLADACEKSHNVIYVPMLKEDIISLLQFIFTKEERLISTRLYETLMQYSKVKDK